MNKAIIRNISNAIPGGSLAVITGDGFKGDIKVELTKIADNSSETPCFSEYVGAVIDAEIVNRTDSHTITFLVPEGKYEVYSVKVITKDGSSNTYRFNNPEIKWIMGESIIKGQDFRILGQALVNIDSYEKRDGDQVKSFGGFIEKHNSKVVIKDSKGNFNEAPILKASSYDITAKLPENVELGECEVYVSNGCGGKYGWSDPIKAVIVDEKQWPAEIFNVVDYGAKAIDITDVYYENFFDSTQAFQKALDAAKENGGGIVFVPNGRYCFKGGLRIPKYTKLVGEDLKRVWLELPKGMKGEDGWGTFEEGMKIKVFLGGESDFSIENLNIMAVYSPLIIGAPVIDGEPLIGNDVYNRIPCYANLLDQTKDADNVTIKNCNIVHEPTFLSHRKDKADPFYVSEYDNRNKVEGTFNSHMSILGVYAGIAIKGHNMKIIDNQIQGAGSGLNLLGPQNAVVRGNKFFAGELGNCIAFFSTSYNPNENWSRVAKNIVLEENVFDIATNQNRGVMWIMEAHTHYYMARNIIKPFYWHADAEGFCFHTWGNHWLVNTSGGNKTLPIIKESFAESYEIRNCDLITEKDGSMKESVLKGFKCTVIGGTGLGQTRTIVDNTDSTITVDSEWDCELDETSVINISDYEKFNHTLIIDNEVNELGRGVYYWGSAFNSVVDGNILSKNSGCLLEDLSKHYQKTKSNWQFAGHYFSQIINNKLTYPRGFCTNYGVIGVSGGRVANSTVSMIIRGNVAEDDSVIVACPREKAKEDLNYKGIVIENNFSKNCKLGIQLDENISATLKDNQFENVEQEVIGKGDYTKIL